MNPIGSIGGAEKVLLTIFATLLTTQPKIQIHLIVGTDGLLIQQSQKLGVQVTLLKLPEKFNQLGDSSFKGSSKRISGLILLLQLIQILPSLSKYFYDFHQLLHKINPDLIHSNGIKTHLITAFAGVKDKPVIWHIHDFYGSRPLMAKILKLMSFRATQGIAISQAVAQDAKATLPDLPIEVIYNAVDINYFSPSVSTSSSSSLPLRIGLVATFARWKGQDIFLEAANQSICTNTSYLPRFTTRQSQWRMDTKPAATNCSVEYR
ncbi:MAG: glycosyltransferase [Gloeotrichia echinulata CP02]